MVYSLALTLVTLVLVVSSACTFQYIYLLTYFS